MTQISSDDVQTLARMSALELSDEQIASLQRDLSHTIDYFSQLSELDTSGVEPTYHLNNLSNRWREDTIESSLDREILLALAPDQKNAQIKVPKVL